MVSAQESEKIHLNSQENQITPGMTGIVNAPGQGLVRRCSPWYPGVWHNVGAQIV